MAKMLPFCILVSLLFVSAHGKIHLEKMNIDPAFVTVSGASSGAGMATQMHVIFSSTVKGCAILAGVPYYCAENNLASGLACMKTPALEPIPALITATNSYAFSGQIDSTSNLLGSKVYVLAGTLDTVVNPGNGPKIEEYYSHYGAVLKTEYSLIAEHAFPTNFHGPTCEFLGGEYINNCDYHCAYELLNFLNGGDLIFPTGDVPLIGNFDEFDQSDFFHLTVPSEASMDKLGYIYTPSGCIDKSVPCKLHVAFHGCGQGRELMGDTFARYTGYLEVAELNNIIVLFPQIVKTFLLNKYGCWDAYGYTGILYATRNGPQPKACERMINKLLNG